MRFDLAELAPRDAYKLLTGIVVPRPIAWVTTVNHDGSLNLAPFSFFNTFGSDPPVVAFAPGDRAGVPKDTAANIRRTREFVVNFVSEELLHAMNVTAAELPHLEDEVKLVGLTPEASSTVDVPRIAESPAAFECREVTTVLIGKNRIVLGEVLTIHVRDDLVDPEKFYVDTANLKLVGRMGGRGGYVRTSDLVEVPRLSNEEARQLGRTSDD
ncbi:flavin reductase family protein [Deinococcus yavapaiensis]|uniref:Flavin reductase (DIM6/NTAB) family NADH-FMN oxidoreductase RutF n=1 Tax=Deinococcus yavapaiensis KR-236 TaxID=694435 RepID=A0A318S3A0_9DEIO|nr:flavin reductase family protein [Deinococcus yavapaiensis]PYE51905.1 flavin reductase (DIM6/NTAB) family NADH-FMN oxidoreductase RutF [Deinococcus yavapaiensis KR-236]